MKVNYPIIDGHGHILPGSDQIPKSIKDAGYFNIEGPAEKQFMTSIGWRRPVSDPTFFVEPRLEWMKKNNIAHTVSLTLSQLYCNGIEKNAALDIMTFQNDFHNELQKKYPLKFSCGFVVQPDLIDEALTEMIIRHSQSLKFLCLPTHYEKANGTFVSTTDEKCEKIFEFANHLHLPIQIHPYDYEKIMRPLADIESYWSGHTIMMASLMGQFYSQFVAKRLYAKYPNVRFFLSHGNILGLATLGRQEQARTGRPDLFNGVTEPLLDALNAKNVFYDTITHDVDLLDFMKKKVGTSQMIHGIDSPFPLGWGVDYLNDGIYPGYGLDKAHDLGYITTNEKHDIFCNNVFNWLYGDKNYNETEHLKRLILNQ